MPMTRIIYYNISTRFIPRGSAKPVVNFKESRTRGLVQRRVIGNPGTLRSR
jgi:hypothetical protein